MSEFYHYHYRLTPKADIVNYSEAVEQADVVTFLVAHKEFKDLEIETDLDFCGVTNN